MYTYFSNTFLRAFIMRFFASLVIIIALFFSLTLGVVCYIVQNTNTALLMNSPYCTAKPTILLDDQGKEWARFELYHAQPIQFPAIPKTIINAFIAAEDHNFFKHPGISLKGIVRSLVINLYHGRALQGASTITQQLTRLLFLDNNKNFMRKIKEQFYALWLELNYTKEQILEAYLNTIYLGSGIYGIQAAAHIFWGKPIADVTLAQAATLAAIIKSPTHYCPLLNPQKAQKRRNIVLRSMLQLRMITQQEYEQARQEPLITNANTNCAHAPHWKELLRVQLEQLLGKHALYTQGFIVQTTLNHAMQECANSTFNRHVRALRRKLAIPLDGAIVALESSTGAIKAVVGGYDFTTSKLNRAVQIKRQIGSLIKPLIYAQALHNGLQLTDVAIDEPLHLEYDNQRWSPRNVNRTFLGPMTLAYALATSNNIIAIKLLLHLGIPPLINLLQQCSIANSSCPAYPSLALGCIETSPLKTAAMFNIFANNGTYMQPYSIVWIKDANGKKIYKHTEHKQQIFSWNICSQINSALQWNSKRLQKRISCPDEEIPVESIVKTGTTNNARSCYVAGSTPDWTTVIYLGCDDNRPLKDVYASATIFPVLFDLYHLFPFHHRTFINDPHLQKVTVDPFTGRPSGNGIELLINALTERYSSPFL